MVVVVDTVVNPGSRQLEEGTRMQLAGTGVWSGQLRYGGDPGERRAAATELEALGYSALWLPGGIGGAIFDDCRALLEVTERVPLATGILNLWMHTPEETAEGHAAVTRDFPGRFLLGIGISHGPLVDSIEAGRYQKPLAKTRDFLEALDRADPPVPVDERALAALGPKMLELARDRTAGAHPYLVAPEHTHDARAILGPGKLLAPEQHVFLGTDAAEARAAARNSLQIYLGLPNYTNNWLRYGMTPDDLADGGSDRLCDTLVAWGDEDAVAQRVQEHHDAGADHVCIQVVTAPDAPPSSAMDMLRALAPALTG
jgi:probable F420-dependent oxidoreductase